MSLTLGKLKNLPPGLIVHRDMKVTRSNAYVRMPRRVPNFGQVPAAGQRVANECLPPVVNRERCESLRARILKWGYWGV
jgi:hypothetical protein